MMRCTTRATSADPLLTPPPSPPPTAHTHTHTHIAYRSAEQLRQTLQPQPPQMVEEAEGEADLYSDGPAPPAEAGREEGSK